MDNFENKNMDKNIDETEEKTLQALEEEFKYVMLNYVPNWQHIIENKTKDNDKYYIQMCDTFRRNLKDILDFWGATMQEMGDNIGFSKQYISKIVSRKNDTEHKIVHIPVDKLDDICRIYDTSVPYLLGFDEAKEDPPKNETNLTEITYYDKEAGKKRILPIGNAYATKIFTNVDYYFWEFPNNKYCVIEDRVKKKPLKKLMVFQDRGIKLLQEDLIRTIGCDSEMLITLINLLSVDKRKRNEIVKILQSIKMLLSLC